VRESKPLVAAVNGVAVGVGLTMILPFDVIVASEKARFGMFFVKMGLVPELASTHYLVQRVGFALASEMCLSGRLVEAEEAASHGLVNRVVPAEKLVDEAVAQAQGIAAHPDRQLRMIKGLLTRNGSDPDLDAVMKREFELLSACYSSPEHREAIAAFTEKRVPKFR
jgi:2-(1,2-epoxy-1,2-dihydrophenyl)acetyl-CoA isomerase